MRIERRIAGTAPPERAYDADIIILALDRVAETEEAIRSGLGQRGLSRHVIVVDQGSRPENLARLARLIEGRTDTLLVQLESNRGVAGGRNAASALGCGRIIIGLDNDAIFPHAHTAAAALAAFEADPALGAVGFRILSAFGGEDHSSWGYPPRLRPRVAESFEAATFVGAGHAIRRGTWERAGPYDESLFFCWEEYDFCLRAIAHGWTVRYRGDIAVLHKVSPQQRVSWSARRWYFFLRNRLYIERKYGASWTELLPRIAGYTIRGLRNGLPLQTARGFRDALRMSRGIAVDPLPETARAYLARADAAHRGSLFARLLEEVLPALPSATVRPAAPASPAAAS